MTWKVEKHYHDQRTTIRLIGRMQVQHQHDLRVLSDESGPTIALDLEELTVVDLEAVRFLGRCQNAGVSLLQCSQYIREWVAEERTHRQIAMDQEPM
jgi:anti-anti-sigma regulatory factor